MTKAYSSEGSLNKSDAAPHFGHMMQKARVLKGWSKEEFAFLYAKALGKKEPLTVDAIEALERSVKGPMNPLRREIIGKILDLPLAVIGIEQAVVSPAKLSHPKREHLDKAQATAALNTFWSKHLSSTAVHCVDEMTEIMQNIHNHLPYTFSADQKDYQKILYQYHIVMSCIVDSQGRYSDAAWYINKSLLLAKKLHSPELQAASLYRRGNVSLVTGRPNIALSDYAAALNLPLNDSTSAQLKGSIQIKKGLAYSQSIGPDGEKASKKLALLTVDAGGKFASATHTEDQHFLKLNPERYHLDKALTFINLGYYQLAIEELSSIRTHSDSACRSAYSNILLSKAYLGQGHYPIAVAAAMDALMVMTQIKSQTNITRIAQIYQQLKASPYGNNIDVMELGIELWKYDSRLL